LTLVAKSFPRTVAHATASTSAHTCRIQRADGSPAARPEIASPLKRV
jgi:hypothetical protein